jgi:hypothetical protein
MTRTRDSKFGWKATHHMPVFVLLLGLAMAAVPLCSAQTETGPSASEGKELETIKAEIVQLQAQVNYLAAATPMAAAIRTASPSVTDVTLTGRVSCRHCEGIQPWHKGYTQYSWALNSVAQGDDVILVSGDKTYTLEGDKDQVLKFMCEKARISGHLEAATLNVQAIGRPAKND